MASDRKIALQAYQCPACGAPVPAPAGVDDITRCAYCLAELRVARLGYRPVRIEHSADLHLQRAWIGGSRYAVRGRIARGASSDVFLARRDRTPTEWVVLKVLRAASDRDLLEREWRIVTALAKSSARGAEHFGRLLPQPVAHGEARLGHTGTSGVRLVTAYRYPAGFVHTFEDVRREHPAGVQPEAAVWLFKRVLELLDFLHRSDVVHGSVLPEHLLVHARDHGVIFTGYSSAGPLRRGAPLPGFVTDAKMFYPPELLRGAAVTAAHDVAMGARSVIHALAGDAEAGEAPASTPAPLADLLGASARGEAASAAATREALVTVSRQLFGPPRYVPFAMPGWGA